jgi:hypothetical protein
MADDDTEGYEDEDDLEMATNWFDTGCAGSADFDADWVTYLATTDPPSSAENFDASLSDYEDGDAAGQEETSYA